MRDHHVLLAGGLEHIDENGSRLACGTGLAVRHTNLDPAYIACGENECSSSPTTVSNRTFHHDGELFVLFVRVDGGLRLIGLHHPPHKGHVVPFNDGAAERRPNLVQIDFIITRNDVRTISYSSGCPLGELR